MKDLFVHFHYDREGLRRSASFCVPNLPRAGDTVLLPPGDDDTGGEPGEEWTVEDGPVRWEFCRAHDEQLSTHAHLRLVLATGQ